MHIAVVGGTGTVGSAVVRQARERGHDVVVLARSRGVDIASGQGLLDALERVDSIVDASNTKQIRRRAAVAWFERASRNLVDAAHSCGVTHIVPVSIVGIDDVPLGYYAGKKVQEWIVRTGPVPWTIVRATQFFTFPQPFLATARAGVALVPSMRCQPVAVDAVADLVIDAVESPDRSLTRQIAGPSITDTVSMARRISLRTNGPRVVALPIPGAAGRAIRAGGLLPGAEAQIDTRDFDTWVSELS